MSFKSITCYLPGSRFSKGTVGICLRGRGQKHEKKKKQKDWVQLLKFAVLHKVGIPKHIHQIKLNLLFVRSDHIKDIWVYYAFSNWRPANPEASVVRDLTWLIVQHFSKRNNNLGKFKDMAMIFVKSALGSLKTRMLPDPAIFTSLVLETLPSDSFNGQLSSDIFFFFYS